MSQLNSRIWTILGIGIGVSVLSVISAFIYKRSKKESIPKKWREIGTLDKLYFIPIKSCMPIELDEADCEILGVRKGNIKDRALMIIDNEGRLVTARTYPKMFKISPKILRDSEIVISAPGMDDIRFNFVNLCDRNKLNGNKVKALIYGYYADVVECGEMYNKWFSQFILGKPEGLRMVYYPHKIATRPIGRHYEEGIYTKQDTGTFQDMSSYNLINNVSVDDLNTRFSNDQIVPLLQFRSNFYVANSGPAFDEDFWKWVRIGNDVVFRNIGPCYRCILPNINPYTAERHPDGEPLKTLKKFRVLPGSKDEAPALGIQLGLRAGGKIKRGDIVYIEVDK